MGRHVENAKLQEMACWALCHLAANPENTAKIGAQVENRLEYTRVYVALTRAQESNIAISNRKHTHTPTQGGIEAVVTAMRRHAENAKVQENACGALWSLAFNSKNTAKIGAQVENIHDYI
jgi:hypothetical protein